MAREVTRRKLVGAGLVVAAFGGGIPSVAFALNGKDLDLEKFYAATYKLLGQQPANPFFAKKIFAHIVQRYPTETLNALSALVLQTAEADLNHALAKKGLITAASEIVNVWYSGTISDGASEAQVVGYIDNLSWQAIKFSTPQSVCGGHFGHWHKLPTGQ